VSIEYNREIKKYFSAFNSKDINVLQHLLHQNVILEDWEGKFLGLSDVISVANKVFQKFPSLKIEVLRLVCTKDVSFAEIRIQLNSKSIINVVDVFEFKNGKIEKIRAFKK